MQLVVILDKGFGVPRTDLSAGTIAATIGGLLGRLACLHDRALPVVLVAPPGAPPRGTGGRLQFVSVEAEGGLAQLLMAAAAHVRGEALVVFGDTSFVGDFVRWPSAPAVGVWADAPAHAPGGAFWVRTSNGRVSRIMAEREGVEPGDRAIPLLVLTREMMLAFPAEGARGAARDHVAEIADAIRLWLEEGIAIGVVPFLGSARRVRSEWDGYVASRCVSLEARFAERRVTLLS